MQVQKLLRFLALTPAAAAVFSAAASCGAEDDARSRQFSGASLETVKTSAERGDAAAQNELGRRAGLGLGMPRNAASSLDWYRKSADQAFCAAEANVAFMYLAGEGTQKDAGAARDWALKAAGQGAGRAQYMLGYLYATGALGKADGRSAEEWFLKAANQGDVASQRALIKFYEDGELVPANPVESARWLHRVRDAAMGAPWRKDAAQTTPSVDAAGATDAKDTYAMQMHLGVIGAWQVGPEAVLRYCRKEDPTGEPGRAAKYESWQKENATLRTEVELRFNRSLPMFPPANSPANPVEAVRAAVTLSVLKQTFLGKSPDEVVTICKAYAQPDFPLWSPERIDRVRASMAVLEAAASARR
ncbi:tetratricopeptide repeat protein [Mitsuaria sp. 7]|uniref:tetratricopeptide repeat protein n=1 Tax=Mitsuaria sp. 7 TaxID=1658665 RepID=UPI0008321C2D|nr:tetratricopeptide repeat protein [Mitsuaria sp. 7]